MGVLESGGNIDNGKSSITAVLAELDVRGDDRVLIMLPDGPGFTESFTAALRRGALPLPVSPQLSPRDLSATATYANARLVLASRDKLPALAALAAQPPILVNGPRGFRAAALCLR